MNNYILIIISVLLAALGQLLLKKGAVVGSGILTIFTNYFVLAGLFSYILATLFWVLGLSKMQLINVYPFTFLTFALVIAGAYFFLGEKISALNLVTGSVLIILGIFVLSIGK